MCINIDGQRGRRKEKLIETALWPPECKGRGPAAESECVLEKRQQSGEFAAG